MKRKQATFASLFEHKWKLIYRGSLCMACLSYQRLFAGMRSAGKSLPANDYFQIFDPAGRLRGIFQNGRYEKRFDI